MKRGTAKTGKAREKPVPKKKRGRPSKFTPAIASKVIVGLSKGTPLTVLCAPAEMPHHNTVRVWADNDPQFSSDIARAREVGHDAIAERARETARGRGDSTQDVHRDKLIVDTDLKLLAKWDPKRYGDKLTQEISGPDGGPIRTDGAYSPEKETELAALMQSIRDKITTGAV